MNVKLRRKGSHLNQSKSVFYKSYRVLDIEHLKTNMTKHFSKHLQTVKKIKIEIKSVVSLTRGVL